MARVSSASSARLVGTMVKALVAVLVLSSPVRAAESNQFPQPAGAPAELQERLRRIMVESNTPGMGVVLLNREGTVWSAGIGLADVAEGRLATSTTLFRVGSISKMFVALSVLKLVEEGKLSLEASVASLVPEIPFTNPWEATDPIRVVHLLEHTTGWDDGQVKVFADSGPAPISPAEGLARVWKSRVSRWRPGAYFAYCNAGPVVAAAIIEKVTGRRFEDYVEETFFHRLGMSTADYFDSPRAQALLTKLYRSDGKTPCPYWHSFLRPSGSLNASAQDMAVLLRFFLRRGRTESGTLLEASSIQRMETAVTSYGARGGLPMGYGLCNGTAIDPHMRIWHGHDGGIEGAQAELSYVPEQGIGYFFAINSGNANARWRIGEELKAYLTQGVPQPPPPSMEPIVRESAKAFEGWYVPINQRLGVLGFEERILGLRHLALQGSVLVSRPLVGSPWKLVAVDHARYRPEKSSVPTVVLMDTPDGRLHIAGTTVFLRISAALVWAKMVVSALFVLALVSVPLSAAIGAIRWMRRRGPTRPGIGSRLLLLLACLSVVIAFVLARMAVVHQDAATRFGHPTAWSVSLTVSTWVFATSSLAALLLPAYTWNRRKAMNGFAYYYGIAVACLFVTVALYLSHYGAIGYRSWG